MLKIVTIGSLITAVVVGNASAVNASPITLFTGMPIEVKSANGTQECTLGPLVDNGPNQGFITSAHCTEHTDSAQVLSRSGQVIGSISVLGNEDSPTSDYAYVSVDQRYISNRIASEYVPVDVLLTNEIAPKQRLCKIGATTGKTCGEFWRVMSDGAIETSPLSDNGDSGAAVFALQDGKAKIVGIVSRGNPKHHDVLTPIRNALLGLNVKLAAYH